MRLHNRTFQYVFSKTFVYNILFEDTVVDERFLGLDEDSTMLSITGAGCGVAGALSKRLRSVDAVDINPHHLSLSALKMAAAQHLAPYSTFYDLFGRGWSPEPKETVRQVAQYLPSWMQRYWKKHYRRFERSMYRSGLTARVISTLRKMARLDSRWLREMAQLPQEDRVTRVLGAIEPILRNPMVATYMRSPMQLVTLGINFEQRDRLLEAEDTDMTSFFVDHVGRVAATDLETNWFAWLFIAGHYNHERQDAVPPYLREDRYERSYKSPTRVRFHNTNLFDILGAGSANTWSHYTLCDAPDWLNTDLQRRLLDEIHRTSRDGGVMLVRSVEDECMVEKLGDDKRFQLMQEESDIASVEDRSRQYRRVNFYRIVH